MEICSARTSVPHLIEGCLAGRPDGWEEFVRRYSRYIGSAVKRYLRYRAETFGGERVEELEQEVYCRLLARGCRRLKAFRGSDHAEVVAFLGRVARTVVVDSSRARRAVKRGGNDESRGGDSSLEITDSTLDPETRYLRKEGLRLFLDHCRRSLGKRAPRRDLRIVQLALVEGYTSREIAGRLPGCLSPSTVDSILHRLRSRLRDEGICLAHR
jgi:RNA polymerase sigma factor (sigma-70 family)